MQSPPPLPRRPDSRPRWIAPLVIVLAGVSLVLFVLNVKTAFAQVKSEIREQTIIAKVRINLVQISYLAQSYFEDFPDKEKVSMKELRAWRPASIKIEPIAGENYDGLVVAKDKPTLSVTLPNGQMVEYTK